MKQKHNAHESKWKMSLRDSIRRGQAAKSLMSERLGTDADLSKNSIQYAKKTANKRCLDIQYLNSDYIKSPIAGEYDLVKIQPFISAVHIMRFFL